MIVVDASVAVKWLTAEEGRDAANALLFSEERLVAPELIRAEVAAAPSRKALESAITESDASNALHLWADLAGKRVGLSPDASDIAAAFRLSLSISHPLYDCLYLAVALRLEAPLVTADQAFVEKASRSHSAPRLLS